MGSTIPRQVDLGFIRKVTEQARKGKKISNIPHVLCFNFYQVPALTPLNDGL